MYDPLERDISGAKQPGGVTAGCSWKSTPTSRSWAKFEASFESSYAHVQSELKRHHILVMPVDTVTRSPASCRKNWVARALQMSVSL